MSDSHAAVAFGAAESGDTYEYTTSGPGSTAGRHVDYAKACRTHSSP